MSINYRFWKKDKPVDAPCIDVEQKEAHVHSRPHSLRQVPIWSIGSGKGGVGKSLIASNMAIQLSHTGKKVLLVDADLGAPNLHTMVNSVVKKKSLSDFFRGDVSDLNEVVCRTPIPNVDLISSSNDGIDVASVSNARFKLLKTALERVEYDYVLLDVGPGTSSNMLDFFLISDTGILVTTPEPTSIENTYRFIKAIFLRRIKRIIDSEEGEGLGEYLKPLFSTSSLSLAGTMSDIFKNLSHMDRERGDVLSRILGRTHLSILVNQVKGPEDWIIGNAIQRACSDYFGVKIPYVGAIAAEDVVGDSIRSGKPLSLNYNHAEPTKNINEILNNILKDERKTIKSMPQGNENRSKLYCLG